LAWFESFTCVLTLHCVRCSSCSPPISDFDVFSEAKTQSYFESQRAVMALCTYLEGLRKNIQGLPDNQLLEHFGKLLQVSSTEGNCGVAETKPSPTLNQCFCLISH